MRTFDFNGQKVSLKAETYSSNGKLAVAIVYRNGEEEIITVNLGHFLQSDNMAFLDTNKYPGIESFITENGLGLPMYFYGESGFCRYPLYTIFKTQF